MTDHSSPENARPMKKLIHQFENELGELVDRYLLDGVPGDEIKRSLNYEAGYSYVDRLAELKREKAS